MTRFFCVARREPGSRRRREHPMLRVQKVKAAPTEITEGECSSEYACGLIEASLDPLVTISPEGKITDVNVRPPR
jgi:hypothetical protein